MTEPTNIFRSVYQETPTYGDVPVSRHFKYTMNSFSRRVKVRRVFKTLICLFALLLISLLLIVFGLCLYPNIVPDCKRGVFVQSENEINSSIPLLSRILSRIGICKGKYNDTLAETVQLNISKRVNHFQEVGSPILNNGECKCLNSSTKLDTSGNVIKTKNETTDAEFIMIGKCICNETHETDNFHSNETVSKSDKNEDKFSNIEEAINSADFHINDTNNVDEIHYFKSNTCDCGSLNGTKSEMSLQEGVECKCPNSSSVNLTIDETMLADEQHKPPDIRKCQCLNVNKEDRVNFNGSESDSKKSDVKITEDSECVCPETPILDNFTNKKATDENKMDLTDIGETNDINNFHINHTRTANETQYANGNKCVCPRMQNITDVIFNGTSNQMHGNEFERKECKCPELYGMDPFNSTKNIFKPQESDFNSLKTEKCECPETLSNESIVKSKYGVKNVDGECKCSETQETNGFIGGKPTNDSQKFVKTSLNIEEGFGSVVSPLNKTGTLNEIQSLNSNKCICPKTGKMNDADFNNSRMSGEMHDFGYKSYDECKCPNPDILEIDNFDLHEAEAKNHRSDVETPDTLKSNDCVCPEYPFLLPNGSSIENSKTAFKNLSDECLRVCAADEMYVNETEILNGDEISSSSETETTSEGEMTIDWETETTSISEMTDNGERELVNESEISNGGETENANQMVTVYNAAEETVSVKEFSNDDKTNTVNKKEPIYNAAEETVSRKTTTDYYDD